MKIVVGKLRKGASLIIAMVLTVMVLGVSLSMLPSIIQVKENIEQGLSSSQLTLTRDSAQDAADSLADSGLNPFTGQANGENYSMLVNVGNKTVRQDVWSSTGCPVPDNNPALNNLGRSVNWDELPYFVEYGEYDPQGEVNVGNPNYLSMEEKCLPSGIEQGQEFYFVYPTPLSNKPAAMPVTVETECPSDIVYDRNVNPINHPCYWGRLEPGQTVRIPINRFGWNLADIHNLKLRLRTECRDGDTYCSDAERTQFPVQLANQEVDDTDVLVDWNLEFEDGRAFGPSVGDVEELASLPNCSEFIFCRSAYDHSVLSKYRFRYGFFEKYGKSYFDLLGFGNRTVNTRQSLIDGFWFKRLDSSDAIDRSSLSEFLDNGQNLSLTLINTTEEQAIEYQLVSDRQIRK